MTDYATTSGEQSPGEERRKRRIDAVLWERLFEESLDAILIADDEGRYTRANPAAAELFGYSREQFEQMRVEDLTGAAEEAAGAWEQFLREGRQTGDIELRRADGSTVEVRYAATANIAPERHLSIMHDVSDERRMTRELRAWAEQQAAVAELGRKALSGTPRDELIELAVGEVQRVLGVELVKVLELEEGELLLRAGAGWREGAVGSVRVPVSGSHSGRALRSAEGFSTEVDEALDADLLREHEVVSGMTVVIEGLAGRPFGTLGAHSRTEREFRDDELGFLRGVANVLGAAVASERASALEQQLEQTRRMNAIGELVGGVAHDFNNSLAVILNYLDLAKEEAEETGRVPLNYLDEVSHAAEQAAELTRSLLVFGRGEGGLRRRLDLNEAVRSAVGLLKRTLGEDIELRTTLGEGLPEVRIGPGQIEQVLINLAANARDAMVTGTVTIRTDEIDVDESYRQAGIDLRPGRYLRLEVGDEGRGMDPETVASAFDPFFTTKAPGEGTGLGLATVYGIVQQAGGHVAIYSEPDAGTTVRIYLPVAREDTPAAPTPLAEPDVEALRGSERILLVEDDPRLRELARLTLEGGGYAVVEAADGEEALERQREGTDLDLVLSDVVMPAISGPELVERLRESDPELRCAFMSGYAQDALDRHGVEADAVLIEKPFRTPTLLAGVRRALDNGHRPERSG